jgi:rhomboid protease GluP
MGWVIGLIVFGLIFPGINNWAHGGGLLSGIALSFVMGYNDNKQESAWIKLLAYVCILLTVLVLIWAVANSLFSVKEISI